MLKLDYNLIAKRLEQKKANLPQEIRAQMEAPLGKGENLIKLKRSKQPQFADGDVFVLSPKERVYFYGRILQAKIQHIKNDDWYNQGIVTFIFKCKSKEKSMAGFKADYNNVLVGPAIVTRGYWTGGWFETIGNIPLTEEEKNLDYGFFNMDTLRRCGTFKKANGEELNHEPKFLSGSGITTYIGIYSAIKDEIILDPHLLEF